jgi:hypothetical protein
VLECASAPAFSKTAEGRAVHEAGASFHATKKREASQSVQFPMVSTEQGNTNPVAGGMLKQKHQG